MKFSCLLSASLLLGSLSPQGTLWAKGLDKLQPDTEDDEKEDQDDKGIVDKDGKVEGAKAKAQGAKEKGEEVKEGEAKGKTKAAPPKEPEIPVEPGFQAWYLGTSIAWINTDGKEGDWDSSATGDLELGYRIAQKYWDTYDLYATLRYRPTDVTIRLENRQYRGVFESYLAGVKAQRALSEKLFFVASGEFGLVRTSVSSIDGIPKVDGSLEKSGVDLVIGGGVSYLVLEKLAVGSQLHLGGGTHKTVQLGVDIRFLL